ncbi:phasin family protein [Colwelliaceae bacterium BS250]
MILDFFKTNELTAIGRQVLNANKEIVNTVLATSQDIAKKAIDYNRSIIQTSAGALTSTREEANRFVEQVIEQTGKVEERALEAFDSSSDQASARVNDVFERVGNPVNVLGGAFEYSVLNSVESITTPTVELLKNTSEQLIEVPNKLIRTAANSK